MVRAGSLLLGALLCARERRVEHGECAEERAEHQHRQCEGVEPCSRCSPSVEEGEEAGGADRAEVSGRPLETGGGSNRAGRTLLVDRSLIRGEGSSLSDAEDGPNGSNGEIRRVVAEEEHSGETREKGEGGDR